MLEQHEVHRAKRALIDDERLVGGDVEDVGQHPAVPQDLGPRRLVGTQWRFVVHRGSGVLGADRVALDRVGAPNCPGRRRPSQTTRPPARRAQHIRQCGPHLVDLGGDLLVFQVGVGRSEQGRHVFMSFT